MIDSDLKSHFSLLSRNDYRHVYRTKIEVKLNTFFICIFDPYLDCEDVINSINLNNLSRRIVKSYLETGSIMKVCPENMVVAFYDCTNETKIVGRDKIGIIPVYWAGNENNIEFGTSSRELIENGLASNVANIQAINDFLTLQYIPREYTMWKNVFKLLPGHELIWKKGEKPKIKKYWDLEFNSFDNDFTNSNELEKLIENAYSKIPVNINSKELILISGGIDSSANASYLTQNKHKLKGVTVSFKENGFDESYHARLVGKHFNINHSFLMFEKQDLAYFDEMIRNFDEPNGDQAALATYVGLKKLGINSDAILYSGEGGDEVFGLPRKYLHRKFNNLDELSREYVNRIQYIDLNMRKFIFKKNIIDEIDMEHVYNLFSKIFSDVKSDTQLPKLIYSQIKTWLVDNVITKDRQVSKAFGIKAFFPLLDPNLIEFIGKIPEEKLYESLYNKNLVRKVLKSKLPKEVLDKEKHTFMVPMKLWLNDRRVFDALYNNLFYKDNCLWDILDCEKVKSLYNAHEKGEQNFSLQLWQIYALSRWLNTVSIKLV